MKSIILLACLGLASASFFSSSPTIDNPDDLSGCGELLPKSFKVSYMGFTASCPQCEDGKVKAKVVYEPGRYLPAINIMDASADIELIDEGDSVTINYENLDLGRINHHIINEIPWLNLTHGSYTYDKFSKGKDTLKLKGVMNPGDTLVSKNRLFQLEYQDDGNLVLTEAAVVNFTVWESGTSGKPGKVVLESDGNLVIYNNKNKIVWQSDTAGKSVSRLLLRNDGNIILVAGNDAVWQSGETESDAAESCSSCDKDCDGKDDDEDDEDNDVADNSKSKSKTSYLGRVVSFFKAADEDEDEEQDKENRDDDDDDDDDDDEEREQQEKKRKAEEKKQKEKEKKEKEAKKSKKEEKKQKKDRKKSEKEEKSAKKDRKKAEKNEKKAKKDRKKAEEDL